VNMNNQNHRPRPPKEYITRSSGKNKSPTFLLYDMDRTENVASNNYSIVSCVFLAAGTCLSSSCLATIGRDTHRDTQTARSCHKLTSIFFKIGKIG
jgi:hypothetical protein